jgi:inositol oxygenase
MSKNNFEAVPLANLDAWENDLLRRYPDPDTIVTGKKTDDYRNYDAPERDTVKGQTC